MLWTALGCGISIMIFTIMIGLENQTTATQWTAVAFVILYNLFYGYGWVGCPWLYGPEVSRSTWRSASKTLTPFPRRLPLYDIAILVVRPDHLVNGCSRLSPYLLAELESTELDGKSGSGRSLPALALFLSSTSCVQR
jgi:hypothetical protein